MVSALIDEELKRWKVDVVKSLFFLFEAETILNIPLSYNLPKDKIIWVGNKKGDFTVKSAYYIALTVLKSPGDGECSYVDPRIPLWKKIRHLKIPPKIRIFTWKACENALPTMLNLRKRGVATDGICPICGKEVESICHALFRCNFAKEVWSWWKECPIKISAEDQDFSDIALQLVYAGTARDLEIMVVTAWAIWYNRNQWVHECEKQAAGQVWDSSLCLLLNYKEASKYFHLGPASCEVSWKRPPMGVYKINVDGATAVRGRNSSIGVIIRDFKGEATAGQCRLLNGNFSALEAEMLAVEAGVLLANELGLQQIIIESDSLLAVQSILEKEFCSETGHIVQGILSVLDCFSSWKIRHVKRDFNRVAHELALYAKCEGMGQVWEGCSPPMVRHLIHQDCI